MTPTATRPWHLSLLGLLGLGWYLLLAVDYVAIRYSAVGEMLQVPDGWGAAFAGMPLWASVATALAVWLGLLGAILLTIRDRGSVLTLAFAFLASIAVAVWFVLFSPAGPRQIGEIDAMVLLAVQTLVPAVLWIYARSLKQRGYMG